MSGPALRVIEGGSADTGSKERARRRALLDELYRRYAPSVQARCRYLLRDEAAAEDAMQEVFARALANLARFRGEASPLTWLTKIATHHCLDELRAREHRAGKHPDRGAALELAVARDQIHRQLGRFELETQRAVVHYHVDGMTLEEVAGLLGRSIPTIRRRLARFARALEQEA